jgi:Tfp pilus assembly protein PilE
MIRRKKGITLIELVISVVLLSLLIVVASYFNIFGRYFISSADKRTKVQNELSFALEHMQKYVNQATGNASSAANRPIQQLAGSNGFQVRVDPNTLNPATAATPSNLTDDIWISYTLAGNTLTATYSGGGYAAETLSTRVLNNVTYTTIPDALPAKPSGFYINITNNGAAIEVSLVGRYDPVPAGAAAKDNPQVVLKTRMLTRTASSN